MSIRRTATTVAAIAGLATTGAAAAVAVAAAPQRITAAGVGKVKLGATFTALHAQHLVGNLGKGCELAGPNARAAKLSSPLKGTVNFTQSAPRKVTDISVTAGGAARRVGIGATVAQIKHKFPHASVDHSTDSMFGLTFVKVPKRDGGRFVFGVSTMTKKTTIIGIPIIAVCE
jgi:hypothetical protein